MADNTSSENKAENHSLYGSFVIAFNSAVIDNMPFTLMLNVGNFIGAANKKAFDNPWSSLGKTVTSKFVRVMTEKVISGNCNDVESLNYFQQKGFCINEGSTEAVIFRAGVAFTVGAASSMLFKGVPIFAVFDGINAVLYDVTSELKKVKAVQEDATLKSAVDFLSGHGALVFEGVDSYLKSSVTSAKLLKEIATKKAVLETIYAKLNVGKVSEKYNSLKEFTVRKDELNVLKSTYNEVASTKYHGFIGGALADNFVDPLKTYIFDPITDTLASAFAPVMSGLYEISNSVYDSSSDILNSLIYYYQLSNITVAGDYGVEKPDL